MNDDDAAAAANRARQAIGWVPGGQPADSHPDYTGSNCLDHGPYAGVAPISADYRRSALPEALRELTTD
jgi:hypothetical protein